MNILLTARQPGGGIKTFFKYIYSRDDFSETSLTLVAPDQGLSNFLYRHIPKERLRVIPVGYSNIELFVKCRQLLSGGGFQLLHSHGFTAGVTSELARFGSGVPHLMTAHDVFRPEQFRGIKGQIKITFLNKIYKRLDGIHTVTEDARKNLLDFLPRLDPDKVLNILHGVDTTYFSQGKARDLRSDLGVSPDRPLIGFFGRFMAQKGFRTLVDAIDILKREGMPQNELPLVLTFGWGGFIREDYQYLEGKGLSSSFQQMPATDAMADMLKSVDMVVMPSRWEACGLLAMEALASGVPLIATNCIGLREVLEGSPARVIRPLDSRALATEIFSEMRASTRQEFMLYQADAVKRFAVGRPARELFSLYRAMLK